MALLITGSFGFDLVLVFIACVVAYYKWSFTYWKRKGLYSSPPSIPFGNASAMFMRKSYIGDILRREYDAIKSKGHRHGGMYFLSSAVYVPIDPEIIKSIIQTDFAHFTEHGIYCNEIHDPLTGNLFMLSGKKWRDLRTKLTPTFTSGKMKMMFPTLLDCTRGLHKLLDDSIAINKPLDIKDILGRFTTDVIGSCAFGIQCNSLQEPDNEFRRHSKLHFDFNFIMNFKIAMQFAIPHYLLRKVGFKIIRKDVEKFFIDVAKSTVNYRDNTNISRNDFMQLLLQLRDFGYVSDDIKKTMETGKKGNHLSMTEIAAQAFVFFIAGFETSSTTTTYAFYELAKNPEIQENLRREINTVLEKYDNQMTYDAILEMTYLNNVIKESLRKYPPLPMLPRKCTQSYTIPDTSVIIDKGTTVLIPIMGLHRDPEYFPSPEVFDPHRFDDYAKAKMHPFTYLPFGGGPRTCIAKRFGYMQSMVAIAAIIKNYRLTVNSKTKEPISFQSNSMITSTKGGIWLNAEMVTDKPNQSKPIT